MDYSFAEYLYEFAHKNKDKAKSLNVSLKIKDYFEQFGRLLL